MSLRPGARWSPQTQGIAGGIGSAVAGVSDQIRRVMQDRPTGGSVTTGRRYRQTVSPQFPITSAAMPAVWAIPTAAISGLELMAVETIVRAVSDTAGPLFIAYGGLTHPLRLDAGTLWGGGQCTAIAAPNSVSVAFPNPDGPVTDGFVQFVVLAW